MNNITFPEGVQWQQRYLTGGDLYGGDYVSSLGNFYRMASNNTIYVKYDTSSVTDMSRAFYNCPFLNIGPLLDTSSATNMSYMFYNCYELTSIPLLDTSAVKDMSYMFSGCSKLTSIPLFDTGSVTNMGYMFQSCSKLTSISLIDTSSVANMSYMFYGCKSLTTIPQLDTSSVTNMSYMFSSCTSLKSIPLLDTSSVTNMGYLFGYSQNTTLTDLGGFKDLKISITSYFLDNAPNLTVESLMNVINNLYDLTANGVSGKTLKFGTTNLNKLTAEQIAVATNKGWTLT